VVAFALDADVSVPLFQAKDWKAGLQEEETDVGCSGG
jgi:hypothetical protein